MNRQAIRTHNGSNTRRGQFFSYDAIVAGILFVILLAILYVYWSSMRAMVFTQIDDMFRVSLAVSNQLLTPGNPNDWNLTSVKQIGLVSSFGSLVIDETKLENLRIMADSDYEGVRSRLGIAPYMFYITIGSRTMGILPQSDIRGKFSLSRPAIYRGSPENLTVTIWSNFSVN